VTALGYSPIHANVEQRANVNRAARAADDAKKRSDAAEALIAPAEDSAEAAEDGADQAKAKLAQVLLTHARWRAEEAEKAWLVALAELELAKHLAAQGKGEEDEQLKRELEDQLYDLKNQHAAAARSLAASAEDLKAAGGHADNPY
jgi:hypothetical protein